MSVSMCNVYVFEQIRTPQTEFQIYSNNYYCLLFSVVSYERYLDLLLSFYI